MALNACSTSFQGIQAIGPDALALNRHETEFPSPDQHPQREIPLSAKREAGAPTPDRDGAAQKSPDSEAATSEIQWPPTLKNSLEALKEMELVSNHSISTISHERLLKIFNAVSSEATQDQLTEGVFNHSGLVIDPFYFQQSNDRIQMVWQIETEEEEKESFFHNVNTLIRMVKAHISGEYKAFSSKTIIICVFALLYFVTPTDLIPDFIPAMGLVDDITLVYYVVKSFAQDIETFSEWEAIE
jgi:uncharacterized membrane protein YkvA (DUF1232 family)